MRMFLSLFALSSFLAAPLFAETDPMSKEYSSNTQNPNIYRPIVNQEPINPNIRLGMTYDHEGDYQGDELIGFEISYAASVMLIDQMIASYGHASDDRYEQNYVMLAFEEHYPVSDVFVPYGVAGLGWMWVDRDDIADEDEDGVFAKIGLGLTYKLGKIPSLFLEVNYQIGSEDFWQDNGELEKTTVVGMLGIRLHY